MSDMTPENIRRRVEQWQLAAARSRSERRQQKPLNSEESLAAAVELIALAATTDTGQDSVRERGVRKARRQWATLRAALR